MSLGRSFFWILEFRKHLGKKGFCFLGGLPTGQVPVPDSQYGLTKCYKLFLLLISFFSGLIHS